MESSFLRFSVPIPDLTRLTDKSRIILGIDPGTNILGFGIVRVDASGKPHFVDMGVVDLRRIESPYDKLEIIFEKVGALCDL